MSAARKKGITFELIKKSFIGTFKKYTVFKGRARRQEFWIFFFCTLILGLIPFIGQVIALVTCIPSIAVGVRRLHDTNRSGLWLLFLIIIPLPVVAIIIIPVLAAGSTGLFTSGGAGLLSGLFTSVGFGLWFLLLLIPLVGVAIFLIWAAQAGTHGRNRYGPNPKAKR